MDRSTPSRDAEFRKVQGSGVSILVDRFTLGARCLSLNTNQRRSSEKEHKKMLNLEP